MKVICQGVERLTTVVALLRFENIPDALQREQR